MFTMRWISAIDCNVKQAQFGTNFPHNASRRREIWEVVKAAFWPAICCCAKLSGRVLVKSTTLGKPLSLLQASFHPICNGDRNILRTQRKVNAFSPSGASPQANDL